MRLQELLEEIESRDIDHPLSCDEAMAAVGDVELESPTEMRETVAKVLSRDTPEESHNAQELYGAVAANVDESFVGRKEYDDRAPNPEPDDEAF
ncbi:MAG: hypothetical protein ACLFMT_04955 [Halobacteriales archaeon]